MKVSNLIGDRFKERPASCVIDSHALMVRGGYIKYVANGIYSQLPPMKRISQKIEAIIRDEMDKLDGQEVLFPVALPGSLWEESGRYESVGSELLRFSDRTGSKMVLGMTHEEAAVHMVREYANSYAKYPFMIYQIQTKFRDEARPRAGLIRVREFTMKDAYSFHTSQEDLEQYYKKCYDAYSRIFARCGIPEVAVVASDSGMMGGSISHEYMLLTPAGEDSIAICPECGYSANVEAAPSIIKNENKIPMGDLELVDTPNVSTIEDLCAFLNVQAQNTAKAVVYQRNEDDSYVVTFIRGDLDINETKLTNKLGCDVHPAVITDDSVLTAGFIGPVGISDKVTVLFDSSLEGIDYLVTGGNQADKHYKGFNIARDCGEVEYTDLAKITEGGICPTCGKPVINISRGIEVGNIFQLGTKYSKSMGFTYTDENGETKNPIMGCYGIGVGRMAASICEVRHDDFGPIWPITIAPWQVEICCLRSDDEECKKVADNLYQTLQNQGVEVLYDDRKVRPGAMFADADLLGVPVRVVVSPRNLEQGVVEISTRDKQIDKQMTKVEDTITEVRNIMNKLYEDINSKVQY
ncbi:MAG: proline--tRNA ligase [Lachnospiraceae bacterium]|nr:proline--tRNA ligase [Lachnospiraceae bacterium]